MPSSGCAARYATWTSKGRRSRSRRSRGAQVSRAFLYAHCELRAEIEAFRSGQADAPARLSVRQRASDGSLRARLRAALDDSQRQREELALAHGRVRELKLDRRVGRR
jgi:hypothetical protein